MVSRIKSRFVPFYGDTSESGNSVCSSRVLYWLCVGGGGDSRLCRSVWLPGPMSGAPGYVGVHILCCWVLRARKLTNFEVLEPTPNLLEIYRERALLLSRYSEAISVTAVRGQDHSLPGIYIQYTE